MTFFQTYSATPILGVILLYIILLLLYKKAYKYPFVVSKKRIRLGIFFILILCLYAVQDTDYFHYIEGLNMLRMGYNTHFEDVYLFIAEFVNYENIPFRFIIWGSALFFYIWTIKRTEQPVSLVLFFFVSMFLLRFSYARVSLAMAVGLLGYTFLVKSFKPIWISIILGISIIVSSLLFHKSAILWIIVFLLSLVRLNKTRLYILLIIYPLLIYVFHNYGINYLMMADGESKMITVAQNYMEADFKSIGLSSIIRIILVRFPFYLAVLAVILCVLKNKYHQLSRDEQLIANVVFYIVYISTIFVFETNMNTNVIYYRFLYFSILPLSLLLTIFRKRNIYPLIMSLCLTMGISACLYELLYSYYIASLQF